MSVASDLRREKIREYLASHRYARVGDLQAHVGSSEATIRRDIHILSNETGFRRVRGGICTDSSMGSELSVVQRGHLLADRKRPIGRKAAEFVCDGEVVFLGSGSTTIEVAKNLVDRRNLTVITNSLAVVNVLVDHPWINLVVTGGALRRPELSFIGHIVEKALSELRADKVIMGIQGIHLEHGLTNDFLPEAILDRYIVHFAPQLYVVADSQKLGRIKASFVGGIEDMNVLITDSGADPDFLTELQKRGVRTVVADG